MTDEINRAADGAPVFPQRVDTTVEPSADPSPYPRETGAAYPAAYPTAEQNAAAARNAAGAEYPTRSQDAVRDWNAGSDLRRDSRGALSHDGRGNLVTVVRQRILSYNADGTPVYDQDSEPLRDFTERLAADAQANAIGGHVEHVGVAFHVADGE